MPNFLSKDTTKTKKIVRAGIIGGLYVVLSLLTLPIASGAIQFRVSEALTLLPLFFVEAIPALFVGCMLSNLISGCMALDIVLGSLITLVASILTFIVGKMLKKSWLKVLIGGLFPVILNALFLPIIWLCYGVPEYTYYLQALFLLISQSLSVYLIGSPMYFTLKKRIEKAN